MKLDTKQIMLIEKLATLHLKLNDKGLDTEEYDEYDFLIGKIDFLPLES